jgi:3-oxoacyl-[acyl-carrier protein] reductase
VEAVDGSLGLPDLRGRSAIVTGAANGIGRATAARLAAAGADVGLADVDARQLDTAVAELRSDGSAVWGHRTDVTSPDDLADLMARGAERGDGRLDILVANVGVMFVDDLDTVSLEDWDRCLRLNLTSVMLTIQAALPLLRRSGDASVVALSSGAGLNAHTLAGVAYASAKAGVAQLVRVLGTRLGPAGIRVNAVAPGAADTAMTQAFGAERVTALEQRIPLRRIGTPGEVANAILFLASPLGSYVNGEVLRVSGGI